MTRPWLRFALGVLLSEALPILFLVAIVALFGPRDAAAATVYAERMGRWVGPTVGPLCVLLFSWWALRRAAHPLKSGALFGAAAAGLDLGLLVASGAPFEWLFALSNAGRLLAGIIGARVATAAAQPGSGPT